MISFWPIIWASVGPVAATAPGPEAVLEGAGLVVELAAADGGADRVTTAEAVDASTGFVAARPPGEPVETAAGEPPRQPPTRTAAARIVTRRGAVVIIACVRIKVDLRAW
jgi:hypothetical protein